MASEKQLQKWYNEAMKYNTSPEYAEAYARYKAKAKKADQRLVRIEALSHEKYFKGVKGYSYKGAIRDIQSQWGGDKRFNTAPPSYERDGKEVYSIQMLEAKISDIEKFLSKPTSTKSNIIKFYKKRADTINSRYKGETGIELSWEDIANYYQSNEAKKSDKQKASKTVVRSLFAIKKAMSEMSTEDVKDIKKVSQSIANVDCSKVVKNKAIKLLSSGQFDYSTLYSGK